MIIKIEDLKDIILVIKSNSANIIEEITQEEIDLYVFIQEQFNKQKNGEPGKNFKKLFLLFYGTRINQIPTYFDKLFDNNLYNTLHKIENFDELKIVFEELLDYSNSDSGKYQYSYISKLIHTINPDFPIYDSFVMNALELEESYDTGRRRKEFWNLIYKKINNIYQVIIEEELLKEVIEDFSIKRDITHMNNIKILDFLFWGTGAFKIKNKKKMEEKEMEELKVKYNKEKYEAAADKYKPAKIKYLLIAESPPYTLTKNEEIRYFYFDKITDGDTLLRNTIESIFSEKYDNSKKGFWLKKLKNEGFFLIDAVEYPIDQFKKDTKKRNRHVRINFNNLIEKIEKLKEERFIDKNTKIILIKKNIFEILGEKLKEKGFNVLNDKLLPFPSKYGNPKRYQEELKELLMKDKNNK
jgi:hypothetical protein